MTATHLPTFQELIDVLHLRPHPEGGFYAETYRSAEAMAQAHLPQRYEGERHFGTAIFYLLTPGTYSALHRLQSDEVFHHYLGSPVEMLLLEPGQQGRTVILGKDVLNGQIPQVIVPRGAWQGCRPMGKSGYSLLGCTVAPGFDFADFELAQDESLARQFPLCSELIRALWPRSCTCPP